MLANEPRKPGEDQGRGPGEWERCGGHQLRLVGHPSPKGTGSVPHRWRVIARILTLLTAGWH